MAMNLGMPPMNPNLFGVGGPGDMKRPRLDPQFMMSQNLPLGPPGMHGPPYPDMTSPGFLPPMSMPSSFPNGMMSQPLTSQPITPNNVVVSQAGPSLNIEQSPEKIKSGVFDGEESEKKSEEKKEK